MNEQLQHYFSESPAGDFTPKKITVPLAGSDISVFTAGNVFSPGHLDRGTEVLLRSIPEATHGPILDLGCGWGPIALTAALESPTAEIWAVDVNERARELTQRNATLHKLTNIHVASPEQVPEELVFQEIRSNPPIRIGKVALHELLSRWLPRLAVEGVAYLVVAKQLGADSLQKWIAATFADFSVERIARDKGFYVIEARRVR